MHLHSIGGPIAIYPFLILGDRITKATLRLFGIRIERSWLKDESAESTGNIRSAMVNLLKTEGVSGDRREEVINALDIDNIQVDEIMIPREDIVTLTTEKPFQENLEIIREHMHARYPLVGKTIDDFKGILYTPEITANMENLLNNNKELDDFDWPKLIVDHDMAVSKLIDCFQEEHQELALVRKNERLVGLVTLTDTFETIIGSTEDPLDLIND